MVSLECLDSNLTGASLGDFYMLINQFWAYFPKYYFIFGIKLKLKTNHQLSHSALCFIKTD